MERVAVRSSNVRSVGYSGGILEVEFHSGGVYQYHGVPEHVYAGLVAAHSKGTYLDRMVKGVYGYSRVG
ncbi:KTSC domain-containing protein [Streptomyces sp. S.PB5]|uniref:KTSC domain-containing protein n=1 Tax=Streptomyces sp. S.PB5 TaxID=3020844 RepID=UPI0025B018B8|nr:KTSC domain-containing protein [Streptomyces sp. S.PB5]MDN3029434.1 KTSC domain-containing protein [Streptomyces sp. S.PB5]